MDVFMYQSIPKKLCTEVVCTEIVMYEKRSTPCKAKAKAKDLASEAKTKDLTFKDIQACEAKTKAKDLTFKA